MNTSATDLLDKIRNQFDAYPYPNKPPDQSPYESINQLYLNNLVTPYYFHHHQLISTEGKRILDIACGTGYLTLVLAAANPGAEVIGIDISEKSLELAKNRLNYHPCDRIQFIHCSLDKIDPLGKFDYIVANDILYLLPDIAEGLKKFKSILTPNGIIKTNLHSSHQRHAFYRAQELFQLMGLMDENPGETEMEILKEFFYNLKDGIKLKQETWLNIEEKPEQIMMNLLFQGDKGFTIPQLFAALDKAELELIRMVNWWQWNILDIFEDPDNLPTFLALTLPDASLRDQLTLYELIHPIHRLLDFWCSPAASHRPEPESWTRSQWETARIYLHPQLQTAQMRENLSQLNPGQPLFLSHILNITQNLLFLESTIAACVFAPLLSAPQTIQSLIQRWLLLCPLNLVTLEPTSKEDAFHHIRQVLIDQEKIGYIIIENVF